MILFAVIVVAFLEYATHRWVLHYRRNPAGAEHMLHHGNYTHTHYTGPEKLSLFDKTWVRMVVMATAYGVSFAILDPRWAFMLTVLGTLHAGLWNLFHNEMHRPTGAWFSRNCYFRFVNSYHQLHHRYPKKNFGFLFAPIFDKLFGTNAPSTR